MPFMLLPLQKLGPGDGDEDDTFIFSPSQLQVALVTQTSKLPAFWRSPSLTGQFLSSICRPSMSSPWDPSARCYDKSTNICVKTMVEIQWQSPRLLVPTTSPLGLTLLFYSGVFDLLHLAPEFLTGKHICNLHADSKAPLPPRASTLSAHSQCSHLLQLHQSWQKPQLASQDHCHWHGFMLNIEIWGGILYATQTCRPILRGPPWHTHL